MQQSKLHSTLNKLTQQIVGCTEFSILPKVKVKKQFHVNVLLENFCFQVMAAKNFQNFCSILKLI